MKRLLYVAAAAVAVSSVTGCAANTTKEPSQSSQIVAITQSNNAVILRQLDLQLEREKTRRAEIEGENAVAGAIMRIAEKGGETTKVNGQTALLGIAKSKNRGYADGAQTMPQLPPQQLIQPERDWLDRTLQVASVVMPGGIPAVLSPVLAFRGQVKALDAQTEQARISGQTQQALYGTFSSLNATTVAGMTNLGVAGFSANGQIAQAGFTATAIAAAKPGIVVNAGGDVVVGGGAVNKTNCYLTAGATSGYGAPGGYGGYGAPGGDGGGTGFGGTGGYGAPGAYGGAGGPVGQTASVNCASGK